MSFAKISKFGDVVANKLDKLLHTKKNEPKAKVEEKTSSVFHGSCSVSKHDEESCRSKSFEPERPQSMQFIFDIKRPTTSNNFLLSGEEPAEITPSNEENSVHSSSESTRSNSDESESSELFFSVEETKPYRCICGSCEDSDVEKVNKVYNRDREWKWGLTKEVLGKLEHDLKKLGCLNPTPRQMELLYVYGERPDQDSDSVS
jgi:hypothetical protein